MIRPPGAPGRSSASNPIPGGASQSRVRDLPDDLKTPDLFGSSRLSDGAISHLSGNIVLLRRYRR
jgi:hypothetical protein